MALRLYEAWIDFETDERRPQSSVRSSVVFLISRDTVNRFQWGGSSTSEQQQDKEYTGHGYWRWELDHQNGQTRQTEGMNRLEVMSERTEHKTPP